MIHIRETKDLFIIFYQENKVECISFTLKCFISNKKQKLRKVEHMNCG